MEKIVALLENGTVRRWALGGITTAIILANSKFNLGLTEFHIGSITALAVATILGSNYKAAQELIAESRVVASENAATGGVMLATKKTENDIAASLAKLP